MSKWQRFQNIVIGIGMLLGAVILLMDPEEGCLLIALFLAVTLIWGGISKLLYYFSMARHMVGGKMILLIGVVFLDAGIFTLALADESRMVVILYLLCFHAFAGVVNILRSLEAMRYKSTQWRINMAQGVVSILMLVASIIFARDQIMLSNIYCADLVYSAVLRIASAFRRSAMVFIQ